MTTAVLAGEIAQGRPIDTSVVGEVVDVPRDHLDDGDAVYRAKRDVRGHNIERGDIVIVEPRPDGNATTGELVLAAIGENAYIGRWWTKRGRRVLMDERLQVLSDDEQLRVMGTITVIMRYGSPPRKRRE